MCRSTSRHQRKVALSILGVVTAAYVSLAYWIALHSVKRENADLSSRSEQWRISSQTKTARVTATVSASASGTTSQPFTSSTSQGCYLDLEPKKHAWINGWLEQDAPILDAVLTKETKDPFNQTLYVYQITFIVKHIIQNVQSKEYWDSATWFCDNENNPGILTVTNSPVHLVECIIQDPAAALHTLWPSKVSTKTNATIQYPMIAELARCHSLQQREDFDYFNTIKHTNKEPLLTACTIVRDVKEHIPPWIEYHRLVGFDYVWIFVNEEFPEEKWIQRPYVKYIPYNYVWDNHKMHSTNYRKPKFDIFWQESMQMQCLYHAKSLSNIEWLTMTDIDEYIFVNNTIDIDKPFPLKSFLVRTRDQYHHLAGMVMNSVFFGRNPKKEPGFDRVENITRRRWLMDYVYRQAKPKWQRYKVIYQPRHAVAAEVHYVRGGERVRLADVYFQHYKKAERGVAKSTPTTELVLDARLRDRYRQLIYDALYGKRTTG